MSEPLPVVAIEPSPRNDLSVWLAERVGDREIRTALIDPESLYRRYRAEVTLLLDLLLPRTPARAPANTHERRTSAKARPAEPEDPEFGTDSLLR